jgi:hypothetical protein
VEALWYGEPDSMMVDILVHVVDGYLNELETWRGDLGEIQTFPTPVDLQFIFPEAP